MGLLSGWTGAFLGGLRASAPWITKGAPKKKKKEKERKERKKEGKKGKKEKKDKSTWGIGRHSTRPF